MGIADGRATYGFVGADLGGLEPVSCGCAFAEGARSLTWASGGAEGTRTPDPLHAMEVRYQLRHSPAMFCGPAGTNPAGPRSLANDRHNVKLRPVQRPGPSARLTGSGRVWAL